MHVSFGALGELKCCEATEHAVCRQVEEKKLLQAQCRGRYHPQSPATRRRESASRGAVTLEIPRLWATIMADYYDKLKKQDTTETRLCKQTLLSNGVETNYPRGRPVDRARKPCGIKSCIAVPTSPSKAGDTRALKRRDVRRVTFIVEIYCPTMQPTR